MLAASVFPLAPSKTSSATGNAPGSRGGLIAWFIANPVAANLLLLIVVLANGITLITTLSFSAVATNERVGVGGAYYIVSRSLGIEIGVGRGKREYDKRQTLAERDARREAERAIRRRR